MRVLLGCRVVCGFLVVFGWVGQFGFWLGVFWIVYAWIWLVFFGGGYSGVCVMVVVSLGVLVLSGWYNMIFGVLVFDLLLARWWFGWHVGLRFWIVV